MVLQPLRAFFMLLLVPLIGQAFQSEPQVDVLIPKGMPIKIAVQRDQEESEILKYIVRRTVPKDAVQAKITMVMLDQNGTIKFSRAVKGDHLSEPMSIATADPSIARILLVVEWLETGRGKWVLNTKTQQLDIDLLVKHGAGALPNAKFIGKKQD
jgi:hypothetical protein